MSMTRLCRQVGDSDLVARQAVVTVADAIWKGVTQPKGVKRVGLRLSGPFWSYS